MRILHVALAGLLAAAPVVTTVVPATAHAEEDEAKLKQRLEKLEKENAKLREELAKAQAETRTLFDGATRAERAAGLVFRSATAVASEGAPAGTPPVSAPMARHGIARFDNAELELTISFAQPRTVRAWRVHSAVCDVNKKAR